MIQMAYEMYKEGRSKDLVRDHWPCHIQPREEHVNRKQTTRVKERHRQTLHRNHCLGVSRTDSNSPPHFHIQPQLSRTSADEGAQCKVVMQKLMIHVTCCLQAPLNPRLR